MFASAMQHGGTKCFFHLMEQHATQSEPAYCGLSTLLIILNSFAVDPKQNWKGPWRWYHDESSLNCCLDMKQVETSGVTLPDFQCLAICQGLQATIHYATLTDIGVNDVNSDSSPAPERTAVTHDAACGGEHHFKSNRLNASIDDFRQAVRNVCCEHTQDDAETDDTTTLPLHHLLAVSYNRKVLGQTGTGHFSPLAAYDEASDSVLILDTARFKYSTHWVPLSLLFEAMCSLDPTTELPRGYAILSYNSDEDDDIDHHALWTSADLHGEGERLASPTSLAKQPLLPRSLLFRSKRSQDPARREYYRFLKEHRATAQQESMLEWPEVVRYWTRYGQDVQRVFSIVEPQWKTVPVQKKPSLVMANEYMDSDALVTAVRALIEQLIQNAVAPLEHEPSLRELYCRSNRSRTLDIRPIEAIFVVYLASLDPLHRARIVQQQDPPVTPQAMSPSSTATLPVQSDLQPGEDFVAAAAREQLLAEAELVSLALIMSQEKHDQSVLMAELRGVSEERKTSIC
jgi:glutathione gamma-glutamylcysteinyltransferase